MEKLYEDFQSLISQLLQNIEGNKYIVEVDVDGSNHSVWSFNNIWGWNRGVVRIFVNEKLFF